MLSVAVLSGAFSGWNWSVFWLDIRAIRVRTEPKRCPIFCVREKQEEVTQNSRATWVIISEAFARYVAPFVELRARFALPIFMSLAILVLAAGKGTRMESDLPKVTHSLLGKPLLAHVLEAARALAPDRLIAIVGHRADLVEAQIAPDYPEVEFVNQGEMLGTGHAVTQAHSALDNFEGDIIVTCGDAPLLTSATLDDLRKKRAHFDAAAAMLVGRLDDAGSYGRVVMDESGQVAAIIEAKDAAPEILELPTVNAGTYCFRARDLWPTLSRVTNDNRAGEYYLTDVIGLLREAGHSVVGELISEREMTGINTKSELAALETQLQSEARGMEQSEAQPS